MKNVIIILGSPNSQKGRLSKIAIGRARKCLEIFNPEKDMILCTGGFGVHFNTSEKPHADYLKQYLIKNGILNNYFLPFANSSNTLKKIESRLVLFKNFVRVNKSTIVNLDFVENHENIGFLLPDKRILTFSRKKGKA